MPFIVKNTTILGPLDLICPHRCKKCGKIGEILCGCCKKDLMESHKNHCPICKQETNGVCEKCQTTLDAIWVFGWRDQLIGRLIKDYKYHSIRSLAPILADSLDNIIPYIPGKVVIVPLPTTPKHIRERGFDHIGLICKHLIKSPKRLNWQLKNLILREKSTVQVGNSSEIRQMQAQKAYSFNQKQKIDPDATYLLVDDVWTTGATTTAAADILRKNGAEKIAAAILATNRLT